jgi:hypothetical protein
VRVECAGDEERELGVTEFNESDSLLFLTVANNIDRLAMMKSK